MFLTPGQLQNNLAGRLKTSMDAMPAYWAGFIVECQQWAYGEIVSRLAARGFTSAQIVDWDRGAEFERCLTLYWALVNGDVVGGTGDLKALSLLDRRLELDTVFFTINGKGQAPENTEGVAIVSVGPMDTSEDVFVPIDQDDPDLGEVMEW